MRWAPRALRRDQAQSSVEFALVLPVLLVVALGVAQVGLVVLAKLSAVHTAREVARAVSVDHRVDVERVAAAAVPVGTDPVVEVQWRPSPLPEHRIAVVTTTHRVPALFGDLLPDIDVTATVAMLAESDP